MSGVEEGGGEPSSGSTPDKKTPMALATGGLHGSLKHWAAPTATTSRRTAQSSDNHRPTRTTITFKAPKASEFRTGARQYFSRVGAAFFPDQPVTFAAISYFG